MDDEQPAVPAAPEKPAPQAKPEKTPEQKRIDELEAQLQQTNKRVEELTASERYWAERARGAAAEPAADDDSTYEEDDFARGDAERRSAAPAEEETEKPEKFLDDLSASGLKALKARGVLTQAQFDERMQQLEQRIEARFQQQQQHNAIDAQLAKYPDLQNQQSALFKAAQVHFRQMVADDPKMKDSPAALLSAVRMAQRELDLEAKVAATSGSEQRESRRERIERQMPERPAAGHTEDEPGPDMLSPQARQIVSHLSRFGASEDGFRRFASRPERNGR